MNEDVTNLVKNTNHYINLSIFGAISGLIGLLCYYKFNKVWARIVFGIFLSFFCIGFFSLIIKGKIIKLILSLIVGAVVGLITGSIVGRPKWTVTEEIQAVND